MSEIIVTSIDEMERVIDKVVRKIMSESFSKFSEKSKPETEILSAKQASEYLNIPQATLYFYTCKRLIPFSKKGKRIYFNKEELSVWIESGRKTILV